MILQTIHLPTLYDIDRTAPTADLNYAACIGILRQALENCVLLQDPDDRMFRELDAALKTWPSQRRKEARKILTELKKRHRFVSVDLDYSIDQTCQRNGCRHALGIAAVAKVAGVIGPCTCVCRKSCGTDAIQVLTPASYPFSPFSEQRRLAMGHEIVARDSSGKVFEEDVWKPVFRYAKHVRLFDRMVGRSVTNRVMAVGTNQLTTYLVGMHKGESPPPLVDVPRNFAEGLIWVFEQFLANAPPAGVFEFTTEVGPLNKDETSPDRQQLAAAACVLKQFAIQASGRPNAKQRKTPFTLKVKVGKHDAAMPHARFLFTDQIALVVDRGFDLLDGEAVRDVFINHVQDPGRVESLIDALEDAPLPRDVLPSLWTVAPNT